MAISNEQDASCDISVGNAASYFQQYKLSREVKTKQTDTQVTYGKGLLINMKKLVLGPYLPDFTS